MISRQLNIGGLRMTLDFGLLFPPLVPEELLNYHGTLVCQDTPYRFHTMIQLAVIQHSQSSAAGACLGVRSAVNNPSQPRMDDSSGAHGARFNCNIEVASLQPVVQ